MNTFLDSSTCRNNRANHATTGRFCSLRGWQSCPNTPVSRTRFIGIVAPQAVVFQFLLQHRPYTVVVVRLFPHPLIQQQRSHDIPSAGIRGTRRHLNRYLGHIPPHVCDELGQSSPIPLCPKTSFVANHCQSSQNNRVASIDYRAIQSTFDISERAKCRACVPSRPRPCARSDT